MGSISGLKWKVKQNKNTENLLHKRIRLKKIGWKPASSLFGAKEKCIKDNLLHSSEILALNDIRNSTEYVIQQIRLKWKSPKPAAQIHPPMMTPPKQINITKWPWSHDLIYIINSSFLTLYFEKEVPWIITNYACWWGVSFKMILKLPCSALKYYQLQLHHRWAKLSLHIKVSFSYSFFLGTLNLSSCPCCSRSFFFIKNKIRGSIKN